METILVTLFIVLKAAIIVGLAYLIWRWGYVKGKKSQKTK